MRARAPFLAVLAAPWLGACDATVVLGTDCPPLRGACVPPDAGAPDDSGQLDAEDARDAEKEAADADPQDAEGIDPPDAGDENDAEIDTGPAVFPPFQNASFELREGGSEGALMAFEMPSSIAPWYACRTGLSVLSAAPAGAETVTPSDGATFLGDSFPIVALNLNGVNQNFDPPLRAGQHYGFAVDLWSQSGPAGGNLKLEVASGSCIPPVETLASSDFLPSGGWQRACLYFIPERDVSSLVLMVTAPEEYLNIGARLYLDNIRPASDCR